MKVIDFEPQLWFLLRQGNDYFIDVNCSHSFVGYGRFIQLDASELKEYKKRGKLFLNDFASDIQYYGMNKKYTERHILGEINALAYKSILKFNEDNPR